MRKRPLYGRKGFWLREFADTAEGSLAAILTTLTGIAGSSCLCLKVADGVDWVGSYDAKTPIGNVADLAMAMAVCELAGVTLLPVVVPRGIAGEAEFHGTIAQTCGALMVDIEPYAGFYDQAPLATIPIYWRSLRAAAGDAYLMAQPDPRQSGWIDGKVSESWAFFDAICAQHYVGWQQVGWTNLAYEISLVKWITSYGKDTYVTIYGADPSYPFVETLPSDFWRAVQPTVLGLCVFAFGPMNRAQLSAVATLPAPAVQPDPLPKPKPDPKPQPDPVPVPVPSGLRQALAYLNAANAADLLDDNLADADVFPVVVRSAQLMLSTIGANT